MRCEVCGGTSISKKGDFFVCDKCGIGYTLEEMKKLADANTANPAHNTVPTFAADRQQQSFGYSPQFSGSQAPQDHSVQPGYVQNTVGQKFAETPVKKKKPIIVIVGVLIALIVASFSINNYLSYKKELAEQKHDPSLVRTSCPEAYTDMARTWDDVLSYYCTDSKWKGFLSEIDTEIVQFDGKLKATSEPITIQWEIAENDDSYDITTRYVEIDGNNLSNTEGLLTVTSVFFTEDISPNQFYDAFLEYAEIYSEQYETASEIAETEKQNLQNDTSSASETDEPGVEFISYDMNKVLDDFDDNALAADNKYRGKYMKGSVRIADFGSHYFSNLESFQQYNSIGLSTLDSQYTVSFIKAALTDDVYEKVLEYHQGDVAVMYLEYIGLNALDNPEFILYDIE